MYAPPKDRTGPVATALGRQQAACAAPLAGFQRELAAVRAQGTGSTGAGLRATGLARRPRLLPVEAR